MDRRKNSTFYGGQFPEGASGHAYVNPSYPYTSPPPFNNSQYFDLTSLPQQHASDNAQGNINQNSPDSFFDLINSSHVAETTNIPRPVPTTNYPGSIFQESFPNTSWPAAPFQNPVLSSQHSSNPSFRSRASSRSQIPANETPSSSDFHPPINGAGNVQDIRLPQNNRQQRHPTTSNQSSSKASKEQKAKPQDVPGTGKASKHSSRKTSKSSEIPKNRHIGAEALRECRLWIRKHPGIFPRDNVISRLSGKHDTSSRSLRKHFNATLVAKGVNHRRFKSKEDELATHFRGPRKCKAKDGWLSVLKRNADEPYVCSYGCGLTFSKRVKWQEHEETNWVQEVWRCRLPGCEIRPAQIRKDHLKRHLQTKHKIKNVTEKMLNKGHIRFRTNYPKACIFEDCETKLHSWNERNAHVGDHLEKDWDASMWRELESSIAKEENPEDLLERDSDGVSHDESDSASSRSSGTSTASDYGSDNNSDNGSDSPNNDPSGPDHSRSNDSNEFDGEDRQDPGSGPASGGSFDPSVGQSYGNPNHVPWQDHGMAFDKSPLLIDSPARTGLPLLSKHLTSSTVKYSNEEMRSFILMKYLREHVAFELPYRDTQNRRQQQVPRIAGFIIEIEDVLSSSHSKMLQAPAIPCGV